MIVGQPSEETVDGAKAMLADHLYERFGRRSFAIALHDTNLRAAGTVGVVSGGPVLAGVTSVDVTLRGIGGHGAIPQDGKDPIVMAGEFIVGAQTIVSRQEDPHDPSVVTIGDIHGGTKRNVIPYEVKMELTTRAFSDKAMKIILFGIKRTAQGVPLSAGVPDDRQPIVTILDDEPLMASEDFGLLGLEGKQIPIVMFWLGAMDPAKLAAVQAAGQTLPGPHTSRFEPVPEPTLRTCRT